MTLFNRYEAMTPAAQEFSERVERALRPLVEEMADKGASVRGLFAILIPQVDCMLSEIALLKAVRIHKEERKAKKEAPDAQLCNKPAD